MAIKGLNNISLRHYDIDETAISERARQCCEMARAHEELGNYQAAQQALSLWWTQVDKYPQLDGLEQWAAAEVLLRAGTICGWLGSAVMGGQKKAAALLSGSIAIYELLGDKMHVAEVQIELAYCYYREGLFDLARTILRDAYSSLPDIESDLRAVALIRGAIVERHAGCLHDARRLLLEAAPLADASSSFSVKGRFHLELATTLKNLGVAERCGEYTDQALIEYTAAKFFFEQLQHIRYCAIVENNLGFLHLTLGKLLEAHHHLESARALFISLNDHIRRAVVDETRTRLLVIEERYTEAEKLIWDTVETLEKSGEQALLAEALITRGVVLSRLLYHGEARSALERARHTAEQCGDREGAGRAALTLIEEQFDQLSDDDRCQIGGRAEQLLVDSQHLETLTRLRECTKRIAAAHQIHIKQREEIERVRAEIERQRAAMAEQHMEEQSRHIAALEAMSRELQQSHEHFRQAALHDSLTGLPNRALLKDHLNLAIERVRRRPDHHFAVLFLDVDRFKTINDSLGHAAGDQLLVVISRRLENCLRPTDTVARLGGDEFAILLNEIEDAADAIRTTQRVQRSLAQPYYLNGHQVYVTASIGVALYHNHKDSEDILRDADTAMYEAKENGKARHELFDKAMHSKALSRLHLENDLRRAIERHEFILYYQPIISLESDALAGFEALIRWRHPERGFISPAEFIPVAEETGLIITIGDWVLHEACRQMSRWHQQNSINRFLTLAVNLSSKQFLQPDLSDRTQVILQDTGLDARCLKLEITESAVMEDAKKSALMLRQLREVGIQISIDDFGTGYSSLSYLHQFPVTTLKVDRSFISRMAEGNGNIEIVRTIRTLAYNLGMEVVAEGVETAEQLSHLKAIKCEYGQGYLFSRPVDAVSAGKLINNQHRMQYDNRLHK